MFSGGANRVVLKGLDALLELVGGIMLWIVSPKSIAQFSF